MGRSRDIPSGIGAAVVGAIGLTVVLYTAAAGSPAPSPAAANSAASGSSGEPEMYGEPTVAARYWRQQHTTDCAEMAVADVVGEITGREPTEQEITVLAETTPSEAGLRPVWQPWGFTDIRDLPKLLGHFGIAADNIRTDMDGLKRKLAAGQKVIAIVNAETLWNRPGKRDVGNHFVVVTGVDAKAGVVHLNDSAISTGRDETVSTVAFGRAWATNGGSAIVTR